MGSHRLFDRVSTLKRLDATLGAVLCRVAGRLIYWRRREVCVRPVAADAVRRILVVRPGGMGDMLLLLPVLELLQRRFPAAQIDLVCERRNLAVLDLAGVPGGRLAYDRQPCAFLWRLARTPYDVAIDTEQFHNFSAIFGWLSGAPVRVGFKINPLRNPLYTHLVNYAMDGTEVEQFRALLAPLGVTDPAPPFGGCLSRLAPKAPEALRGWLASSAAGKRLVVVHPGSGATFKRWSPERFSELLGELTRSGSLAVALVGQGRDARLARQLQAGAPRPETVFSVAGDAPLVATAGAIRAADAFVGADSGLAHLAVALGVPTVVLFGPSDEAKWGARGPRHVVVSTAVPCRPCCIFGYHKPCHSVACMQAISVTEVLAAVAQALNGGPDSGLRAGGSA